MKLRLLFLVALFHFFTNDLYSQVRFNKTLGDSANQLAITKSIRTSDGMLVLCGNKFDSQADAFLMKMNEHGDTLWSILIGEAIQESFQSVCELPSGLGYLAAGNQQEKGLLCKIDTSGQLVFSKSFFIDSAMMLRFVDIIPVGDSVLVTGYYYDTAYNLYTTIIKMHHSGNMGWAIQSDAADDLCPTLLFPLSDNRFMMGGTETDAACLVLFDSTGSVIWGKSYWQGGPDESAYISNIDTTHDGQFILTLDSWNFMSGWDYILYNKIDTLGNTIWTRWPQFESAKTKVYSLSSGNYIVIQAPNSPADLKITILDSLGSALSTVLDTSDDNTFYAINFLKFDDHVLITSNHRLISGDTLGNSTCHQIPDIPISVTGGIPTVPTSIYPTFGELSVSDSLLQLPFARGTTIQTNCFTSNIYSDAADEHFISLFPNPAGNNCEIQTTLSGTVELGIVNMMGHLVYQSAFNERTFLDLSIFASGIYFVWVRDGLRVVTEKLIVK